MRVGVLGGSFDPVHKGHIRLARMAERACSLDQVLFVPCAKQPLKKAAPTASAGHRCAMIALAMNGRPNWLLDTREIDRGGVSYTVNTLESLRKERPEDELFLLAGEDSLFSFARWRRPERILKLATLVIARRNGATAEGSRFSAPGHRVVFLRHGPLDVSSSGVRERIRGGKPVSGLVPSAVAAYIERQGIYRRHR